MADKILFCNCSKMNNEIYTDAKFVATSNSKCKEKVIYSRFACYFRLKMLIGINHFFEFITHVPPQSTNPYFSKESIANFFITNTSK